MNTLKRKYNCDNVIIASDMSQGVSLERLVSRINEDSIMHCPARGDDAPPFRHPAGTTLTRSISMVTPQTAQSRQVTKSTFI